MMKELSMHILDIVENSVRAGSPTVDITITEDTEANKLSFVIVDKGKGMSAEMAARLQDPFVTSRTARKVGLGIPLLAQTCHQCGGTLNITTAPGEGTTIEASMQMDSIDRPPLGDIGETIRVMIIMRPEVDFLYTHRVNGAAYTLDTVEIKEALEDVPLSDPAVMQWLKEEIEGGLAEIGKT